jgi:hypothetical protein
MNIDKLGISILVELYLRFFVIRLKENEITHQIDMFKKKKKTFMKLYLCVCVIKGMNIITTKQKKLTKGKINFV